MKTNTNELLQAAIAEHNYRPSSEAERIAREEADNVARRERFYREWYKRSATQLERERAARSIA